jgi:hypothetical protein
VRFFAQAEPAVEKVNSALGWSGLESRLRELSKLTSDLPTKLTAEPSIALAHDPHDAFTTPYWAAATGPQGAIHLPAVVNPPTGDQTEPVGAQRTATETRSVRHAGGDPTQAMSSICHQSFCSGSHMASRHESKFVRSSRSSGNDAFISTGKFIHECTRVWSERVAGR